MNIDAFKDGFFSNLTLWVGCLLIAALWSYGKKFFR